MLGLLCGAIYWAIDLHFERMQERVLDIKINKLAETAQAMLRPGDRRYQDLLLANAPRRPGTHLELLHADGRVFHRDEPGSTNALPRQHREKRFDLVVPGSGEALKGRYAIDTEADERTLAFLRWVLLLSIVGGAAGAAVLARVTVRRGLRPLAALALRTQAMSADQLGKRLVLSEPVSELQPWVDQFNRLMERLEQAYRQMESFNADVAHELRTPLSALIGHTELALARERSVEELRETLRSNLEELQRIAAITNDMLFLSRADRGARARRGDPRPLAPLVSQVAEFHEAALHERGLSLATEGDAAWAVDEGLFKQAVSNLIDNAARHAVTGSTIKVKIGEDGPESLRVTVENAGSEMAPELLPRIFERFFRAEPSRADSGFHHGLGLAIVAAIARMHSGRPVAESAGGRTAVGFTLGA